ncbi:MAG: hypothetical protein JWR07_4874 [Nevskia sp.]|nr:hypothetical protein [Nevskia sp.]
MDSLVSLFELIVLGATGLSVAALVGFIVWDSLVDAALRRKVSVRVHVSPVGKTREVAELQQFAKAA